MLSTEQFKKDTFSALNNPQLRGNFKHAMSGLYFYYSEFKN